MLFAILGVNQASAGCEFFRRPYTVEYSCRFTGAVVRNENDVLDFSGQHLAGHDNSRVEEITFVDSQLDTFPSNLFEVFPNLSSISANGVGMTRLTEKTLLHCGQLLNLFLSNNAIYSVDDHAFRNCRRLRFLQLASNQISFISENAFRNTPNLNSLYLNDNQLTELPEKVLHNLPRLENVYLDSNRISRLSADFFKGSNNLQVLRASHNQIAHLPVGAFADLLLYELDLSHNLISSIGVGAFSAVAKENFLYGQVSLKNNKLTRLSSEIFNGVQSNVVNLDIRNNRIDAIEKNFLDFLEPTRISFWATGNVCVDWDLTSVPPVEVNAVLTRCFRNF